MKYSYYPGCASEGNALANHYAFLAIAKVLNMEIEEIEDWNCCGATVVSSVVGDFPAQVLAARNLALAKNDLITNCSSCYTTLGLTNKKFDDVKYKEKANIALKEDDLSYGGNLRVRFLLDVLVNDVGVEKIAQAVKNPLKGLKIASYEGCQSLKSLPKEYDDPEYPTAMKKIIKAIGAEPVEYASRSKCCTGSLALSGPEITMSAVHPIIEDAVKAGADIIVTPCPLCQMNLDVYQAKANKMFGTNNVIPILFTTQLLALAFGLNEHLGLNYCVVPPHKKLANWM